MERYTNPAKTCVQKFYVHEITAVNLSKIYLLKSAKKTCTPNNRDLNRDWKTRFSSVLENNYFVNYEKMFDEVCFNPIQPVVAYLYPLKTSENL